MLEKPLDIRDATHQSLPDHARDVDRRGLAIEKVGIKGLVYPIRVMDKANKMQATVAEIDAYVGLEKSVRGTHMSRLIEIINSERSEITLRSLPTLLKTIQRRLESDSAHLHVRFPYFLEKSAPVSGAKSLMDYPCEFIANRLHNEFHFTLVVTVPVTSLCPCSKAVSKYGAHNQRSHIRVQLQGDDFIWIEDVIEAIEKNGSAPLYALLKRSDEKWVTETAYENAKFVEDLVRDSLISLRELPGVSHIRILAENFESIHNHSAFAELAWSNAESQAPHQPHSKPASQFETMDFGQWLKQIRVSRKLSQQDLSEKIGTSPSFLSRVEKGEKRLSTIVLKRLANALGLDEDIVQLRAGVVPDRFLQSIATAPEDFLGWANTHKAS